MRKINLNSLHAKSFWRYLDMFVSHRIPQYCYGVGNWNSISRTCLYSITVNIYNKFRNYFTQDHENFSHEVKHYMYHRLNKFSKYPIFIHNICMKFYWDILGKMDNILLIERSLKSHQLIFLHAKLFRGLATIYIMLILYCSRYDGISDDKMHILMLPLLLVQSSAIVTRSIITWYCVHHFSD